MTYALCEASMRREIDWCEYQQALNSTCSARFSEQDASQIKRGLPVRGDDKHEKQDNHVLITLVCICFVEH